MEFHNGSIPICKSDLISAAYSGAEGGGKLNVGCQGPLKKQQDVPPAEGSNALTEQKVDGEEVVNRCEKSFCFKKKYYLTFSLLG